jgi:ribosomal protein S24E
MKIISIKEKENKLFNRKEIIAVVEAETVPKTTEALGEIAKKFSVEEDAVKINGVYGKFGMKSFEIKANVYHSKQDKDKTERKTKKEIEIEKKVEEARSKEKAEAKKASEEAKAKGAKVE